MQKDRFVFALIIYGVILLLGAGVCGFLLSGDVSAVANTGVSAEKNPPTSAVKPTQSAEPEKMPGQIALVPEDESGNKNEAPGAADIGQETTEKNAWEQLSVETTGEWRDIIGDRCIVLPKPEVCEGKELVFLLTDMPVEHSIALKLQGCAYYDYSYNQVERIADGQYFCAEPLGTVIADISGAETDGELPAVITEAEQHADPLCGMTQTCTSQEDGSFELNIEFSLDKTYVYNVYETETHYFIALMDAKDIYDCIVVLDAGHGGWDTGTPSYDGKFLEKNINLQVLLYLEELLMEEDIKVYTTRTTDRNIGHTERVALANSLGADMFISIHCNNAYQNPQAHGTEVLYTQYQNDVEGLNSYKLSQLCLDELVAALQLNNRGLFARGDDLTVLQKAEVPAALVELAFMSNAGDMEVLKREDMQRAAAEALYKAILRAYELLGSD